MVKAFLVEKKIVVILENGKHNKKTQLKRKKSKMPLDLILSR